MVTFHETKESNNWPMCSFNTSHFLNFDDKKKESLFMSKNSKIQYTFTNVVLKTIWLRCDFSDI